MDAPDFIPDSAAPQAASPPSPNAQNIPQTGANPSTPDFIPDSDPSVNAKSTQSPLDMSPDFISDKDMEAQQAQYDTTGQKLAATAEGVLRGALTSPGAAYLEKGFGVARQGILERQEHHSVLGGLGEAAGLIGSAFIPGGQAGLLSKTGELAAAASGLGRVGEASELIARAAQAVKAGLPEAAALSAQAKQAASTISYGAKVGSAIVKNAAEMAVLGSGDEVAKMMLQDPGSSAEFSISNVAKSALVGGVLGGVGTGVISPLWKATAGPAAEAFLDTIKNHINGGSALVLPGELEKSLDTLGISVGPELRSGMSNDAKAQEFFGTLRRGENKSILDQIRGIHTDASNSIANSLNIPLEDIANYSENKAGHTVQDDFLNEVNEKYEPQHVAMEERKAQASVIPINDEDLNDFRNKLLEHGITSIGTDSPYYKEYQELGQRILAKGDIGGLDKLRTEINNRINWQGDRNIAQVLTDIRQKIGEFQDSQIQKYFNTAAQSGQISEQILAKRYAANQSYAKFAGIMNDLTNHLGIKDFSGTGTLKYKIANKISPEQLLRKFSPKGNADIIPFLQEHFPKTLESIQRNEAQSYLKSSIKEVNGEITLDFKKLGKTIETALKNEPERLNLALSPDVQAKVKAANTLVNAIPNPKNSGTPAGIMKLLSGLPTSGIAAIGMLTGHGPLVSAMVGGAAEKFGISLPEAYRMSYLKYLGSDQPTSAGGFKAMVNYIHDTYKGENNVSKAVVNVMKRGAQVLNTNMVPDEADRTKIDKQVTKFKDQPQQTVDQQDTDLGHYLPEHQTAVSTVVTRNLQYLASIQPKPHTFGPLDKPENPTPVEIARYNRALDIAIQPAIVLQHVKDGTLMPSDITDLHNMYPKLHQSMSQKLTNIVTSTHSEDEQIPYHTKVGISLFLGQPMDNTMTPQGIMAAQPIPKVPQPQGQGGVKSKKGATSKLGKNDKSYMTATQAAESDRNDRT